MIYTISISSFKHSIHVNSTFNKAFVIKYLLFVYFSDVPLFYYVPFPSFYVMVGHNSQKTFSKKKVIETCLEKKKKKKIYCLKRFNTPFIKLYVLLSYTFRHLIPYKTYNSSSTVHKKIVIKDNMFCLNFSSYLYLKSSNKQSRKLNFICNT